MATDLVFVPGRNKGSENPVLNGNRYILDKKKNDSSYWKCALYRTGCRARIVTVDKQLASPLPQHTQHETQHAETAVHVAKQTLKRRAAEADLPTKYLAAEAVSGMGFEARTKLGCQVSALSRMARRSRQAACRHPSNPRDLEHLNIPGDYILSRKRIPTTMGLRLLCTDPKIFPLGYSWERRRHVRR